MTARSLAVASAMTRVSTPVARKAANDTTEPAWVPKLSPGVPPRGSVPRHVSYWQRRYNARDRAPRRAPLALCVSPAPTAAGAATRWLATRVQASEPR
jgi:hypothetical protein